MNDIREEILDIIVKKVGIEPQQNILNAKIVDLQISSIDMLDIIFEIEERYNIEIPLNINDMQIETINKFIDMIDQLANQNDNQQSVTS